MKEAGIKYIRELPITQLGNIIDFLIEDKIVLELKNIQYITKADYFQLQRYLQSANIKLGILLNFRTKYLYPKRIIKTSKIIP